MPNTWDAPATKLKMDSGGGKKRGMSKQQGDSDNVMSCLVDKFNAEEVVC